MVNVTSVTGILTMGSAPAPDPDPEPVDEPTPNMFFKMPENIRSKEKKMFGHYFGPYPLSLTASATNEADRASSDYYDRNYLTPGGESNARLDSGGLLRDRPLYQVTNTAGGDAARLKRHAKIEIEYALAAGLDGFFCDFLGNSQKPKYIALRDAALENYPTFPIIPMLDGTAYPVTLGTTAANISTVCDELQEFTGRTTSYVNAQGKTLVGIFKPDGSGSNRNAAYWQTIINEMANRGVSIYFATSHLNYGSTGAAFTSIQEVGGAWGSGGDPGPIMAVANNAAQAHSRGELWMAAIVPQNVRPANNSYWFDEAVGTRTLAASWQRAISDGADFTQAVTWSDLSEGGQFYPTYQNGWVNIDLNAYYMTWWKMGTKPTILRDALYVAHRNQKSTATSQYTSTRPMVQNKTRQSYSAVQDVVEVRTFLTAAASVTVTTGGQDTTYTAPAGEFSQTVPLRNGQVSARVVRSGTITTQVTSPILVVNNPPVQDLSYYRVSSLRPTDTYHVPSWIPNQAAPNTTN